MAEEEGQISGTPLIRRCISQREFRTSLPFLDHRHRGTITALRTGSELLHPTARTTASKLGAHTVVSGNRIVPGSEMNDYYYRTLLTLDSPQLSSRRIAGKRFFPLPKVLSRTFQFTKRN